MIANSGGVPLSAGEDAISHLLSRGTHREFGYKPLLLMLVFYFCGAAVIAGSALSTGLFVPMLVIGCLIGMCNQHCGSCRCSGVLLLSPISGHPPMKGLYLQPWCRAYHGSYHPGYCGRQSEVSYPPHTPYWLVVPAAYTTYVPPPTHLDTLQSFRFATDNGGTTSAARQACSCRPARGRGLTRGCLRCLVRVPLWAAPHGSPSPSPSS